MFRFVREIVGPAEMSGPAVEIFSVPGATGAFRAPKHPAFRARKYSVLRAQRVFRRVAHKHALPAKRPAASRQNIRRFAREHAPRIARDPFANAALDSRNAACEAREYPQAVFPPPPIHPSPSIHPSIHRSMDLLIHRSIDLSIHTHTHTHTHITASTDVISPCVSASSRPASASAARIRRVPRCRRKA